IQLTDANVRTVIQLLSAYAGRNIILSPEVRGDVTLDIHRVDWRDGLQAIASTVGSYAVLKHGDVYRVVPRPSITSDGERAELEAARWPMPWDSAAAMPLDFEVQDERLDAFAARLGAACGVKIVVDPALAGTVRVTAKSGGASWRELLRDAGRAYGFRAREVEGEVRLEPRPENGVQFTDANVRTVLQGLALYTGKS